jgi:membrane fusion protein (multidrug efflux system)
MLRPGMMMNVAIQSSSRTGLSVPELAVLGEGDNRYVFVVGQGNRVHRTEVRTGAHLNGRVEVTSGLRPGQRVVTEGIIKVTDGMQVRLDGEGRPGSGGGQQNRRGG